MTVVRVGLNVEQLFHPAPGGIGRYTARLATLLTTHAPADEVVGFAAAHARSTVARISRAIALPAPVVLPLPRPVLYDLWHTTNAPSLTAMSRRLRGLDVVHAPSLAVPPRGRTPLVVTVHDAAFLEHPEAFPRRGRRFHEQGLRAAMARADRLITVSRAAADEIVRHTGVDRDRLRVVPNGVDQIAVAPGEIERVRGAHHLGVAPYVFWVGTQEPRKNIAILVRSFADAVARERLPHTLVLAGTPGWLHEEASSLSGAADLGDRLRVLGPVDDRDLFPLYAGAALFALPSRHEGFGLPVLEAMAQGTPVLCSDAPALAEVADGAAAVVGPDTDRWTDALASLLGDEQRRHELSEAGRARARQFTWERCVEETRAVYEEVRAESR
jgi:glycosyltransferase involved in cell wall biosynthesis